MKKNSKVIVKREDRIRAICSYFANMRINEEVKITNLHKKLNIHFSSIKDILDEYQIIKDAGKIDIIRDKKGKIKRIVRVKDEDKDLFFKKEIREGIANINNRIDEIKQEVLELKKEVKSNATK